MDSEYHVHWKLNWIITNMEYISSLVSFNIKALPTVDFMYIFLIWCYALSDYVARVKCLNFMEYLHTGLEYTVYYL